MIKARCYQAMIAQWYKQPTWIYLFWPLCFIYRICNRLYRLLQARNAKRYQGKKALWVVGNVTVGGNHKTPCVLALVQLCQDHGYQPAIITHGFKAAIKKGCVLEVAKHDQPALVGDEALWLKQQSCVKVFVAKKRSHAIAYALEKDPSIDVLICDDGMQDRSICPDLILALHAHKQYPINANTLPVGPFREPISALSRADWLLMPKDRQWEPSSACVADMSFGPVSFLHNDQSYPLNYFQGQTVYALTAIAQPDRFFNLLKSLGITIIAHAFPDHHLWQANDLKPFTDKPIIMTEKDVIKIKNLKCYNVWCLKMHFSLDKTVEQSILETLK